MFQIPIILNADLSDVDDDERKAAFASMAEDAGASQGKRIKLEDAKRGDRVSYKSAMGKTVHGVITKISKPGKLADSSWGRPAVVMDGKGKRLPMLGLTRSHTITRNANPNHGADGKFTDGGGAGSIRDAKKPAASGNGENLPDVVARAKAFAARLKAANVAKAAEETQRQAHQEDDMPTYKFDIEGGKFFDGEPSKRPDTDVMIAAPKVRDAKKPAASGNGGKLK